MLQQETLLSLTDHKSVAVLK